MTFQHGNKGRITINSVDYSQYSKEAGADLEIKSGEVTVLTKTAENYIPGLKDGKIPLSGPYDGALDSAIATCISTGSVTFQYDPQGSGASGLPRYTGSGFFTKYSIKTNKDGPGTWDAEFQISDGWTRGTTP